MSTTKNQQLWEAGAFISPILQMGKLRPEELCLYSSSHISSRDKSLIVGAFDSVFTAHFLLHRAALGHLSTLHQEPTLAD